MSGGGGLDVEVNDNLMINQVDDNKILNSAVGLSVNIVGNSQITGSEVGTMVNAQ